MTMDEGPGPDMTEEQVIAVFERMRAEGACSAEEFEAVMLMRKQMQDRGITREPLLTRMACEFAAVLVASRQPRVKKSRGRRDRR